VVEFALLASSAFGLGALHALEPGHGKTVVAAYLVGSRGKPLHAIMLGIIVTLTHTSVVFLLGFLSLAAAQCGLGKQADRFLPLASALLILGVGIGLMCARLSASRSARGDNDTHPHDHSHDHEHHTHHQRRAANSASIMALGISGGLVPCHGALAVLLSALAVGRIAQGMALVGVFSVGMASVLVAMGIAFIHGSSRLARTAAGRQWSGKVGLASAALITLVGLGLTLKALAALTHPAAVL